NERTKANLSARAAMRSKVPPSWTPRSLEFTAPVTERNSSGASGLGSNVSICDGPPASQSQTTEVCRDAEPERVSCSRAWRGPGGGRWRRDAVPQRAPSWDANILSMARGLLGVVRLRGSESGGCENISTILHADRPVNPREPGQLFQALATHLGRRCARTP